MATTGRRAPSAALRSAADLSKRLGVGLTVVFGFEANPVGGEALDYWAALREHGESVLGTAIEEAKAAGVEVETLVVERPPAQALAELAEERKADMIVVGSHGERPITAAVLGSTPQKLRAPLQGARCWSSASSPGGRQMIKEFREFILRGNLVDLAVAVVIGTAFAAVVTALVADLITPLLAAIGGKQDFSALTFTINGSEFRYGDFLNALITFVTIAAVVFFFVVKPVNALLARMKTERGRGGADAQVPGVPERDPGVGVALRVLHRAGRAGHRLSALAGRL